jgi:hypothetical protein
MMCMFYAAYYNLMLKTRSKICGFRGSVNINKSLKFAEHFFRAYFLALASSQDARYLPNLPPDLRIEEKTGWRW